MAELREQEAEINATLADSIPVSMQRKDLEVAVDFHDEPFYGKRPELLAFIVIALDWSPYKIHDNYRRRFGIECSYRLLRRVRASTTSRNPAVRFLLLGIGLVLVNVWVFLRWEFARLMALGPRRVDPGRLRFHRFTRLLIRSIEHRLTKLKHPWTNGQVERMIRTLKDATVYRYYYATHQEFKDHLQLYLMAYNLARRLKTLKGLTPFEYICQRWQLEPDRFTLNPYHLTLGLNT